MRVHPKLTRALAAIAIAAVASLAAAGCGEEESLDVEEGEPVELGELRYNVAITRFLNPDDPEDAAYLEGEADPEPGEQYLGVFMTVENEGDEPARVASAFNVLDTRDGSYSAVPADNDYALSPGSEIEPDEGLPAPDTPAATSPTKGAMVLFLLPDEVSDNRPLELEIPSAAGDAMIKLDI